MNEKSSNSNLRMGASSVAAMHLKYILCVNDRLGLGFVVFKQLTEIACLLACCLLQGHVREDRVRGVEANE